MKILYSLLTGLCILLFACNKSYTPKPEGYFRIETGEHSYQTFSSGNKGISYSFNYAMQARIQQISKEKNADWFNIVYPPYQAKIHCSYLRIQPEDFLPIAEDCRNFVYRHTIKADDITQQYYENPEKKIYGILYDIKGDVASPIQFTLTDSISWFFRGALYFDCTPNQDSLAPVQNFIREDVIELMNSFSVYSK